MIERRKPAVAFNMGGMGSAKTNFIMTRSSAGYAEDATAIQQLWIQGKRREAAERTRCHGDPIYILGDQAMVTERLRKYRDAGVTTLKLGLDSAGPIGPARYELLEQIADITRDLMKLTVRWRLTRQGDAHIAEREELGVAMNIEQIVVNTVKGRHKEPEHLARNPFGTVPALELDDGTFLMESLAIVEYLEAKFQNHLVCWHTETNRQS